MPDLTIESGWMCASNELWSTQVVGSKGSLYSVTFGFCPGGNATHDWSCTCPQNTFRHRECSHILAVKNQRCGWHQQFHGGNVDPASPQCPQCGGPVVAIRWGA